MRIYEKTDILPEWKWALSQYVSASGRKVISDWRGGLQPAQRADLDTFIKFMAKMRTWEPPHIKALRGAQKGLTELRWTSGKVQHRLIGYSDGDHRHTLLIGCTHKEQRYNPTDALQTAEKRRHDLAKQEATFCEFELVTTR